MNNNQLSWAWSSNTKWDKPTLYRRLIPWRIEGIEQPFDSLDSSRDESRLAPIHLTSYPKFWPMVS